MLALKDLQTHFQAYLINSDLGTILPEIEPDTRFDASKRLKVYHDAYRIRLYEILSLDFPKTHTLLGDQEFALAFQGYLQKYPSQHFSVRYFGKYFSQFLRETPPYHDYPVFAEMALFEWSVMHTLDAKNAPVATSETLSTIKQEQWPYLCFQFHPSLTHQLFEWDVPKLWQEIDQDCPQRQPVKQENAIRWLFWRKGLSSFFQSCNSTENTVFMGLMAGKNFAEICEELMYTMSEEEIPLVAAQTLYKWVNDEMISHIS